MSNEKASRSSGKTWLIAIVAALIILISILVAIFLLQRVPESEGVTAQMTPIVGGTTAPTATPVTEKPDPASDEPKSLGEVTVGASVTAASSDGSGVRVYSDARAVAAVMELYQNGAEFVVLEPSGEYDTYPVEENGTQWVRVMADDGLVGWAIVAELAPAE